MIHFVLQALLTHPVMHNVSYICGENISSTTESLEIPATHYFTGLVKASNGYVYVKADKDN